MPDRIKIELTGAAETMLQSFYARAQYSKSKNHKFYDAKAVELVERIDYDFSLAEKDSAMGTGVIARTIVLDELVKDFIDRNPDCTVVNIACGLDTRFYRMDNGRITWYNLDLPETIAVRDQIYNETGRVATIGISATDSAWAEQIKVKGKMLFIIEGLSMYLTSRENEQMLSIIHDNFDNATVLMECLAKKWVNKEKVEESIQKTGAKFVFGADSFEDIKNIAKGCHQKTYDAVTLFKQMDQARTDCRIPSDMVPKCPVCGGRMNMNLRCDQYFVEDEAWHQAESRFSDFLQNMTEAAKKGNKVVLLELGVGFNTPTIIRFPFEKLMREYDNINMIRLNLNEAVVPLELGNRIAGINEDMAKSIYDIMKTMKHH